MYVEAFIDGASRKPVDGARHAACAVVAYNKKQEIVRFNRLLGDRDHNEAEYEALVSCLLLLSMSGFSNPIIYSDSAVVVNQINKKWEVKSPKLIPYYITISNIKSVYDFRLVQVPRSKVFIPDELCNKILDEEEQFK
jgi:ribonuclease HI